MRPPIDFFMSPGISAEIISSFVIIICSLMVYYATKEMYELSYYKGIKYFRLAFLFFASAYFFRSIIMSVLFLFNLNEIQDFAFRGLGHFTLFLFIFFSSMAVFALLYSIMWKKWNNERVFLFLFYLASLLISFLGIVPRNFFIRLLINIILVFVMIYTVFNVYKEAKDKNKRNNLYAIYMLLFLFLLVNVLDILVPAFLNTFKLIIYMASITVFLIILYKVLKKTGK